MVLTEHDDRLATIHHELAVLRRRAMFARLSEEEEARQSRLLVQLQATQAVEIKQQEATQ